MKSGPRACWNQPHRRLLTDAGLNSQLSEVDRVVFNRDLDSSDASVARVRESPHFRGAFGMTSYDQGAERMRRFDAIDKNADRRGAEARDPAAEATFASQTFPDGFTKPTVKRYLHHAGMSTLNSDVVRHAPPLRIVTLGEAAGARDRGVDLLQGAVGDLAL